MDVASWYSFPVDPGLDVVLEETIPPDDGGKDDHDMKDKYNNKTIMMRRMSKRFKLVVHKMCLTSVVCLRRIFLQWDDTHNDTVTVSDKIKFVKKQLVGGTVR